MSEEKVVDVQKVEGAKVIKDSPKLVADFTIEQLKVLVYDKSMMLQRLQRELEVINNEITSRINAIPKNS